MSHESDTTKATRIDTDSADDGEGQVVNLHIDGETVSYQLEEGITDEERDEFINSMLGIETPEFPTEVDHPDLEFAENPEEVEDELEGFRTLCRLDGCHETEVFDSMLDIKESDWTEVEYGVGILSDKTDLAHAYCPGHSLTEEEGYAPETDPGSTEHFSTELLEELERGDI